MSSDPMSESVIGNYSDTDIIDIVDVHSERSILICLHGDIRAGPRADPKIRKPIN